MTPTVACVLRSGGEYLPEHVLALRAGIRRHWPADVPLRFVALTDSTVPLPDVEVRPLQHDWQGWWSKMELFSESNNDLGDILYMDLDTMVVGSLAEFAKERPLTLLRDFYRDDRVQSGFMYLPAARRPEMCEAWNYGRNAVHVRGDGEFLDARWRPTTLRWQDTVLNAVLSYKVDIRQRAGQSIPKRARVICFHGKPRPWDTPLWTRPL